MYCVHANGGILSTHMHICRMYPVIPGTMRMLQEDTVLSSYKVPAGVRAVCHNDGCRLSFTRVLACVTDPSANEQHYNRQRPTVCQPSNQI